MILLIQLLSSISISTKIWIFTSVTLFSAIDTVILVFWPSKVRKWAPAHTGC